MLVSRHVYPISQHQYPSFHRFVFFGYDIPSLLWEMAPGIDDEYDDLPMINMVVLHFATLKLPDVSPPPSQTWRAAGKSPSIAGMEICSWDNQLSK